MERTFLWLVVLTTACRSTVDDRARIEASRGLAVAARSLSSDRIELAWSEIAGCKGYRIERASLSGEFITLGRTLPTMNHFVDAGLRAQTHYRYRISVIGDVGFALAEAVTDAVPTPAALVAFAREGALVSLSWKPTVGISRYKLYRDHAFVDEISTPYVTAYFANASATELAVSAVDATGNESIPAPVMLALATPAGQYFEGAAHAFTTERLEARAEK
jgi:hypothetical protein